MPCCVGCKTGFPSRFLGLLWQDIQMFPLDFASHCLLQLGFAQLGSAWVRVYKIALLFKYFWIFVFHMEKIPNFEWGKRKSLKWLTIPLYQGVHDNRELELFFQSRYCTFTIIEDPLYCYGLGFASSIQLQCFLKTIWKLSTWLLWQIYGINNVVFTYPLDVKNASI